MRGDSHDVEDTTAGESGDGRGVKAPVGVLAESEEANFTTCFVATCAMVPLHS